MNTVAARVMRTAIVPKMTPGTISHGWGTGSPEPNPKTVLNPKKTMRSPVHARTTLSSKTEFPLIYPRLK